jgi:hypothetical protein
MAMGGAEQLVYRLVRNIGKNLFSTSVGRFFQEKPLKEFKEYRIPLYLIQKRKRLDWDAVKG